MVELEIEIYRSCAIRITRPIENKTDMRDGPGALSSVSLFDAP